MLKNNRRVIWIALAVIMVGVIAFFALRGSGSAKETVYQTEAVVRSPLVASVGATGTVRARQSATLTWQTDGRVETVNGLIGQSVKAEDVLATLAQNSLAQNLVLGQADLVEAQQGLDNLLLSNLTLAQAQQNLAEAKEAAEEAQKDYDRLIRPRVSDELIQDTQDDVDKLKDQKRFQQWIFDKFYGQLYDGSPFKTRQRLSLMNTQENIDSLTAKLNWYTSRPSELDIEKALAELNVAKAKMEDAQREVDRLGDGKNAADVAAAQARVDAAQATLNMSKIIAPFDGVITESLPQVGDQISSSETAFRLEDLSRLYIELEISEVDINTIELGQPVEVSFDAILEKTYTGQVVEISPVGSTSAGAVIFPVTVELIDADELIKPSMTAAVTVTVREVQDALVIPNRAVRVVNGERIVYVLKDGQPVPVNIRLGAISDFYSEVVGGDLKEGDLVVMNPAAQ